MNTFGNITLYGAENVSCHDSLLPVAICFSSFMGSLKLPMYLMFTVRAQPEEICFSVFNFLV